MFKRKQGSDFPGSIYDLSPCTHSCHQPPPCNCKPSDTQLPRWFFLIGCCCSLASSPSMISHCILDDVQMISMSSRPCPIRPPLFPESPYMQPHWFYFSSSDLPEIPCLQKPLLLSQRPSLSFGSQMKCHFLTVFPDTHATKKKVKLILGASIIVLQRTPGFQQPCSDLQPQLPLFL